MTGLRAAYPSLVVLLVFAYFWAMTPRETNWIGGTVGSIRTANVLLDYRRNEARRAESWQWKPAPFDYGLEKNGNGTTMTLPWAATLIAPLKQNVRGYVLHVERNDAGDNVILIKLCHRTIAVRNKASASLPPRCFMTGTPLELSSDRPLRPSATFNRLSLEPLP